VKYEQDPAMWTQVYMEVPLGTLVDCAIRGPSLWAPPLVGNITGNGLFDDFQYRLSAKGIGSGRRQW